MRLKDREMIPVPNGMRKAVGLLCVALPVCWAVQLHGAQNPARTPNVERVHNMAALRSADDRVTVLLTARRRAVLSAAVPGRVVTINKELGESFELGDVLVQIDDLTYRVSRETAKARFEAAEGDLVQVRKLATDQTRMRHARSVLDAAQANLFATQRLFNDNHSSLVDLENAKRDVVTAQTEAELVEVVSARELIKAKRELAFTRGQWNITIHEHDVCAIRAPYAGHIVRVLVNEHEFADRGTPLLEVVDDHVLLAKFLLPSALFQSIRKGQLLNLAITETSDSVVAKVSHVAAAFDAASRTFEVYAEVDNADGKLWAGMNGSLSLTEIRGQ